MNDNISGSTVTMGPQPNNNIEQLNQGQEVKTEMTFPAEGRSVDVIKAEIPQNPIIPSVGVSNGVETIDPTIGNSNGSDGKIIPIVPKSGTFLSVLLGKLGRQTPSLGFGSEK